MALGLPSRRPGAPSAGDLVRGAAPTFSFEFVPPKTPVRADRPAPAEVAVA